MDDFDLIDDHLTIAEATLVVAAIDDDRAGDDREPARGGRPAATRSQGPGQPDDRADEAPGRRAAGGCAGCGCLLGVAALGAFALATSVGPATLFHRPVRGSLAAIAAVAAGGSAVARRRRSAHLAARTRPCHPRKRSHRDERTG
jgi:hypothetical protein